MLLIIGGLIIWHLTMSRCQVGGNQTKQHGAFCLSGILNGLLIFGLLIIWSPWPKKLTTSVFLFRSRIGLVVIMYFTPNNPLITYGFVLLTLYFVKPSLNPTFDNWVHYSLQEIIKSLVSPLRDNFLFSTTACGDLSLEIN